MNNSVGDASRDRRLSKTTLVAAVCVGTTIWLSLGVLAVTDGGGARRIGVLPSVSWLALLILVAIALMAVIRPSAKTSLPLFLSLLIVLPWLSRTLVAVRRTR